MSTYFVTRHPGARDWAHRHDLPIDRFLTHLDLAQIQPGDRVIGTLPVNLAAEIQWRGCDYIHLSLKLLADLRDRELDADQLDACQARLQAYRIEPMPLPEDLT